MYKIQRISDSRKTHMPTIQLKKEHCYFEVFFVSYPHRNHYLLEISSLFIISWLFWRVLTHMFVSLNRHIVELHVNGVTGRVFLCTSLFVYSVLCSYHLCRDACLCLSIPPLCIHCVRGGHTTIDLSVLPLMDIQAVSSLRTSQQYCCCVSWCM